MRSRSAAGTPGPRSLTRTTAAPPSRRSSTVTGAGAVAARVLQQVADRRGAAAWHAVHRQRSLLSSVGIQLGAGARAFLGRQAGEVHGLDGADVGFPGVEPAGQQDLVDQLVELGDVARDLVASAGLARSAPSAPAPCGCAPAASAARARHWPAATCATCTSVSTRSAAWLKRLRQEGHLVAARPRRRAPTGRPRPSARTPRCRSSSRLVSRRMIG